MARHKHTKVHMFLFTVEGSGKFPFDMLRYDACWPNSSLESAKLGGDIADAQHHTGHRTITLRRSAVNMAGPTRRRWESHGWTVTSVEEIS